MTEGRSKRDGAPSAAEEPVVAAEEPVVAAEEPMAEAPAAVEEPVVAAEEPMTEAAVPAEPEPMVAEAAEPVEAAEPEPIVAEATAADPADAAAPETATPEAAAPEPAEPEPTESATTEAEAAPESARPAAESAESIAAAAAEPVAEAAPEEHKPKRRESKAAEEAPEPPAGPRGLKVRYQSDVIPALIKQFEYANPNMVPRVDKIVVNIGIGEALTNAKAVDAASGDLTTITGQKPIVMKARRSIAQFKIRTGNPIGLKVTLRGQRMWDFLERLTMLALPRIRDFRGTPSRSFDGRGNYTLGLREQIAFPEIDYDKVDRLRGLEVSIVTTAKSDEESKRLLEHLGMPFAS
jgi:large subunit ribosomal protein L5